MTERGGNEPLVKVASAGNQVEAEMWKEMLRNNGIPSLARISGPLTGYAAFASPHELLVLAPDVEAATRLIAAFNAEADEAGPDDEDDEYWMEGAEKERGE